MSESGRARYEFLVESYRTERLKVMSIWAMFEDADLPARPRADDPRGRSVHEHMVHQCLSEDGWFRNTLGIDVGARPLPETETRLEFIRRQQTTLARVLGRNLYSTYGPTADTGGLGQHKAPTVYAYPDEASLLDGEAAGGRKRPLPGAGPQPSTERPDR